MENFMYFIRNHYKKFVTPHHVIPSAARVRGDVVGNYKNLLFCLLFQQPALSLLWGELGENEHFFSRTFPL